MHILHIYINNFSHNKFTENEESVDQAAQQDWSLIWNSFDDPHQLLITPGSLPKGLQDMVRNAVSEMRRYYSRKVVDVLIRVTRNSLDAIRKRFIREIEPGTPLLNDIALSMTTRINDYPSNRGDTKSNISTACNFNDTSGDREA